MQTKTELGFAGVFVLFEHPVHVLHIHIILKKAQSTSPYALSDRLKVRFIPAVLKYVHLTTKSCGGRLINVYRSSYSSVAGWILSIIPTCWPCVCYVDTYVCLCVYLRAIPAEARSNPSHRRGDQHSPPLTISSGPPKAYRLLPWIDIRSQCIRTRSPRSCLRRQKPSTWDAVACSEGCMSWVV